MRKLKKRKHMKFHKSSSKFKIQNLRDHDDKVSCNSFESEQLKNNVNRYN